MRIDPRQQILEFWQAVARFSFHNGIFVSGGAADSNSIVDAEQLLCVLLPATRLPSLRLDSPDESHDDALAALHLIGDKVSIPIRLIHALLDYMDRYTDHDGTPTFRAGKYLTLADSSPHQEEIASLDVVESFAVSIRLTLAAIGFCKIFRQVVVRPELLDLTHRLEELASRRLTAAMVGLLRSFCIRNFAYDTQAGENLRYMIKQEYRDERVVRSELASRLAVVRAALLDLNIISTRPTLEDPVNNHFECGWTWGVLANAPYVEFVSEVVQRPGKAADGPDLYFTMTALGAMGELFSPRSLLLALLNDMQQRLAAALHLRWDITHSYWSLIATFGDHHWPLERLPWRTRAGRKSDYYSLLVAAMAARELGSRRGNHDISFSYLVRVLSEIARRQRIVRPPYAANEQRWLPLSSEPIPIEFDGYDAAPDATYHATALPAWLFNVAVRMAATCDNNQLRSDLGDLADLIWDHIVGAGGPEGGTQDGPTPINLRAFGEGRVPNWHNILCLVEGMTLAAEIADGTYPESEAPFGFVHRLLAEADDTFNDLAGSVGTTHPNEWIFVESRLDRARKLVDAYPARAAALLYQCLSTLDDLMETRDVGGPNTPP